MTYRTSEDFAEEIREGARFLRSMVRRMAITLTQELRWQLLGQRGGTGGDEVVEVEPFTGVGFFSRPPESGSRPEAIMLQVGSAKHPVIVATRDEDVRRQIANLQADETAIFTSKATVVIKADGSVEIRSAAGAASALATKADIDALKSWIASHTHAGVTAGGAVSGPPSTVPPSAAGTVVLKAE